MDDLKLKWRDVAAYVAVAFGFTWTVQIGLRLLAVPLEARATLGMFGPALACVLIRWVRAEGFRDAGLRLPVPGTRRLFFAAYAIPFLALAAATVLSAITGLQEWDMAAGIAADWPRSKFIAALAAVLSVVVALTMISTFGEELGWRGYMLPRLMPLGPLPASIIVGIVWGLWHAPLIVLDGRGFGPGRELLGLVMFVLLCVSWSIYLTWLRVRTDSIWPGALSHATLNVVTSAIFAVYAPAKLFLGSPIGVVTVVCFAVFDGWLIVTGRLKTKSVSSPP